MDSTRCTCSALDLPQTPMYVGSGVIASRKTESLPDVDRKSRILFGATLLVLSPLAAWLVPAAFDTADRVETAAKCSTTSSFF